MATYQRRNGRLLKADDWRLVPPWMTNEDWFVHSEWIAEFWACVSMVPLALLGLWCFARGLWLDGALALHAAIASAVYHAAPFRRLLHWDQCGAGALIVRTLSLFRQSLWPWYAAPLALLVLDTVTRRLGRPVRGLHPVWHTAGPLCYYVILATTLQQ